MSLYLGSKKVSLYLGDKRVRLSIGGPSSILPEGYTQLEYIQSTGTQYINTGITNWNNTLEYEIKLSIEQQESGIRTFFGCYTFWNSTENNLPNVSTYTSYRIANNFIAGYSESSGTDIGIAAGQTGTISLKGNSISWSEGSSAPFDRGTDFTVSKNILLFCQNGRNGPAEFAKTKMYDAKFWLNGQLVFHGIPAIRNSDGAVGMFDTVSGNFFTNAGTGEFVPGYILPAGYTQLEYIQASGTQYINTGYKPNSKTAVEVEYLPGVASSFMCIYGTQTSSSSQRFYALISSTRYRLQINTTSSNQPLFWGVNKNGSLSTDVNGDFAQTNAKVNLTVDNKNKKIKIVSDEYTGTIPAQSFAQFANNLNCAYDMLLFSRGTAGVAGNNFVGRIYKFKVYEDDVLKIDYVPAKRNSDGVIGMYDLVSKTFFTNVGTGSFIEPTAASAASLMSLSMDEMVEEAEIQDEPQEDLEQE